MTISISLDRSLPGNRQLRARDLMSRHVIAVSAGLSVRDAIEIMLTRDISGLPVVDSRGKLAGIVSEGDFLRRAEIGTEKERGRWLSMLAGSSQVAIDFIRQHGRKVGEIMSPAPVTIEEDTTIEQIVRLMESLGLKRFPVMRGDEIVGMVTRTDFMRAIARGSHSSAVRPDTDEHIRRSVIEAFSRASWRPSALEVTVQDAGVTLQGNVKNDNERKAAVVAAENVAGVARVDDQLITYPLPEEDLGGGDIVSLENETPTEDDVPL
jgi:CBS domain-containing protein